MADRLPALREVAEIDSESPRELARAAASGDAQATSRLLQSVAPRMMRVVRVIVGAHAPDIDDVVQQSLIGFVQALPAFRGECEPVSYACRIAVRTAVLARKRARQHHARCLPEAEVEGMSHITATVEDADAFRRKKVLRTLLDEIPEEQAEALAMRSVLGWSLEEIASASGAPLNTVRSRLRLAKEALRKKIASEPGMADELGVSS